MKILPISGEEILNWTKKYGRPGTTLKV